MTTTTEEEVAGTTESGDVASTITDSVNFRSNTTSTGVWSTGPTKGENKVIVPLKNMVLLGGNCAAILVDGLDKSHTIGSSDKSPQLFDFPHIKFTFNVVDIH